MFKEIDYLCEKYSSVLMHRFMTHTMIKSLVALLLVMLLSSLSADALAQSDVSYEEHHTMSVLKGAKDGTLTLVIKSKKELDRVFGPSGFIGPTRSIDFDDEFVIAVVLPKNIAHASIEPVSLKRNGNKLVFSYTIDPTKMVSYPERNFTAIIVNRSQPMKVDFQEVSSSGTPMNGSSDVKALRKQVEYLTSENEQLKKGVEQLQRENQILEDQRVTYINKIKELEAEVEQLKKQVRR